MSRHASKGTDRLGPAREAACSVLRACSHALGLKASARGDGYPQVWARDSMITLLGAVFLEDKDVDRALRASLETLRRAQTDRGLVPNNVDTRDGASDWRAYADGGAWYVIGCAAYAERRGGTPFLRRHWPHVQRTLEWYAYQDIEGQGLVTMTEAADWEDLFATRGKGLTVNVLRAHALRRAAWMARRLGKSAAAAAYARQARAVAGVVDERFWYEPSRNTPEGAFFFMNGEFRNAAARRRFEARKPHIVMPRKRTLKGASHYLPYVTFNDYGEWFDSLGNLLAVLTGTAPRERAETVLDLMDRSRLASPFPTKAIHPAIRPGGHDWREYYRNLGLNLPDRYHNGGVWPFIGGFHVAALVRCGRVERARTLLHALAAACREGKEKEWEFNEWLHGRTGEPSGVVQQAWSAGMFLFADECVRRRRVPFFG